MTDDEGVHPDEREITEEDAIVGTAYGERYRAAEVSKGGDPLADD